MKERIAKLIDVKTIVTFTIIGVVAYLGVTDKLSPDKVLELALIIIGFYFGTQSQKTQDAIDGIGKEV